MRRGPGNRAMWFWTHFIRWGVWHIRVSRFSSWNLLCKNWANFNGSRDIVFLNAAECKSCDRGQSMDLRSAWACYCFGNWWIQSWIWQHAICCIGRVAGFGTLWVTLHKVRRYLSFTRNYIPRTEDSLLNFVQTFFGLCHLHVVQFQPCANRMISNEISIRYLARWWAFANHAGVWWSNGYRKASMRCGQYAPNVALYTIKTPKW